jgi:hypothetical protein
MFPTDPPFAGPSTDYFNGTLAITANTIVIVADFNHYSPSTDCQD